MLTSEQIYEWAFLEREIRNRAWEILIEYVHPKKSEIVGITNIKKHSNSFIIEWVINSLPSDEIKEMPPIRVNVQDFCDPNFKYKEIA